MGKFSQNTENSFLCPKHLYFGSVRPYFPKNSANDFDEVKLSYLDDYFQTQRTYHPRLQLAINFDTFPVQTIAFKGPNASR